MDKDILKKAFDLINKSRSMSELFEKEKKITSKYVHATSKGHEIIQIATALHLKTMIIYIHIIVTILCY